MYNSLDAKLIPLIQSIITQITDIKTQFTYYRFISVWHSSGAPILSE